MKKFIFIIATVILASTGCGTTQEYGNVLEIENVENTEVVKETIVDFTMEKTLLTKGYQSIEPYVEILNTADNISLLVSLGVVECSAVFIEKITRFNNEINIYTTRVIDDEELDIFVPQIMLNLKDLDNETLKNKKINIIATNYEPIELPYDLNQVLNNIYAQAKIQSNTKPEVKLKKNDNSYLWDITIFNAFDKMSIGNPLVNLNAVVSSSTGEIITLNKVVIAEYIDEGDILEVSNDNILFYKAKAGDNEQSQEVLWMYDIENKKQIYSTFNNIYSVKYNPEYKSVAIIENKDENTEVFIIHMTENTILKITPIGYNHIWNIKWDKENLYFVNNDSDSKSTVFKYNVLKNETDKVFELNNVIASFDIYDNLFIFNVFDVKNTNTEIFTTSDGKDIKSIGTGFNPLFLSDKSILYMDNLNDYNTNRLWIYNQETDNRRCIWESDVKIFDIRDENTLNIVEGNDYNTEFTVYRYDIDREQKTKIGETISGNIFFSDKELYINIIPNIKENSIHNIYKFDSNKIFTE